MVMVQTAPPGPIQSLLIFALIWTVKHRLAIADRLVETKEVCVDERLRAECALDHVVVVTSAKYGRMKLGRCVENDLGFVGCGEDVLGIADKLCSGKRSCDIAVPNREMKDRKPCQINDLVMYLEISYTCERVQSVAGINCQKCSSIPVSSTSGIIASLTSTSSSCGQSNCPWILSAPAGQQLNITLLNFLWSAPSSTSSSFTSGCLILATVKESTSSRVENICASRSRRSHVYSSLTNSVELVVKAPPGQNQNRSFLLQYEVTGCPDPLVPAGSWVQRSLDRAKVYCNRTGRSWVLNCHNGAWGGDSLEGETCGTAIGGGASGGSFIHLGNISVPIAVALAIIVSLAVVVGVIILCIGIVFVKRKRALQAIKSREKTPYYITTKQRYMSHMANNRPQTAYTPIWNRPLPEKPEITTESDDSDVVYMHRPGSVHSGYNSVRAIRIEVERADRTPSENRRNSRPPYVEDGYPAPCDMDECTMPVPCDCCLDGCPDYNQEYQPSPTHRHSVVNKRLSQLSQEHSGVRVEPHNGPKHRPQIAAKPSMNSPRGFNGEAGMTVRPKNVRYDPRDGSDSNHVHRTA